VRSDPRDSHIDENKSNFASRNLIIPFRSKKFPPGKFRFLKRLLNRAAGNDKTLKTAPIADPRAFPKRKKLRTRSLQPRHLIRRPLLCETKSQSPDKGWSSPHGPAELYVRATAGTGFYGSRWRAGWSLNCFKCGRRTNRSVANIAIRF